MHYFFKNHRRTCTFYIVAGVISAFTSVFMNYTMLNAVEAVFAPDTYHITFAVALFALMSILVYFSDMILEGYLVEKSNLTFQQKFRAKLQKVFFGAKAQEAQKVRLGDLINSDDLVEEAAQVYQTAYYSSSYALFEIIGFISFLLIWASWKMLLAFILLIPLALATQNVAKRLAKINKQIIAHKTKNNQIFFETLENFEFVKGNQLTNKVAQNYEQKNKQIRNSQNSLCFHSVLLSAVQFFIEYGVKLAVPVLGIILYSKGEMSLGAVASCTTIFSSFLVPSTQQLVSIYKEVKEAKPMLDKLQTQLALPQEENCEKVVKEPLAENVLLSVKNVSFSYDKKNVLHRVSLDLPTTGCIGICGLSGEGKSTLGKVLANLYEPTSGTIIYNECFFKHDEDVKNRISFASYDDFLMADSILNNVSCGGVLADRAMSLLDMERWVRKQPLGVHTVIHEKAQSLSGGQKQMVLLARAMAKECSLLILDEPTSALDDESIHAVLNAIRELAKDKCVVVISHKLNTLQCTDMQFLFSEGTLKKLNHLDEIPTILRKALEEK